MIKILTPRPGHVSMSLTLVAAIVVFAMLSAVATAPIPAAPPTPPTPPTPPAPPRAEPQAAVAGLPKIKRTLGEEIGSIGCQLQDKAGNIWFSTAANGVFRFDGKEGGKGGSFTQFTTADGLCDNGVSSIIQDKAGNILFATGRGICTFDGQTFSKRAELGEFKVTCLLEDRDGNLWFATMANGVFRYEAKDGGDGGTLTNFLNNQQFKMRDRYQLILDILEDADGNIWFSSWNGGGAWRYEGDGEGDEKAFTNFLPSADYYKPKDGFVEDGRAFPQPPPGTAYASTSNNIGDDMVFSMATERSGKLWFALRSHGACRYDPATGVFTHFREKEGLHSRGVYSILEDRKGNIWFTTEAAGVWRLGADGKTFKNFTTEDGLVNNSVFSVLEDKDGNLWFGTRQFGLSRYDGVTFTTFSE